MCFSISVWMGVVSLKKKETKWRIFTNKASILEGLDTDLINKILTIQYFNIPKVHTVCFINSSWKPLPSNNSIFKGYWRSNSLFLVRVFRLNLLTRRSNKRPFYRVCQIIIQLTGTLPDNLLFIGFKVTMWCFDTSNWMGILSSCRTLMQLRNIINWRCTMKNYPSAVFTMLYWRFPAHAIQSYLFLRSRT